MDTGHSKGFRLLLAALASVAILGLVLVSGLRPGPLTVPRKEGGGDLSHREGSPRAPGDASRLRRESFSLNNTTAEILQPFDAAVVEKTFEVPRRAVLDGALALDPLIVHLAPGTARFEIKLREPDGPERRLFSREFLLTEEAPRRFAWVPFELDLAHYRGRTLRLSFRKSFTPAGERPIAGDSPPESLLFWGEPHVRPRSLPGKPNVVLVSLDTVRADHLGYMGYGRETSPHLDRLAAAGAVFTTTVSQAPWTTPAHFSILTSTYPSVHGGGLPIHVTRRTWNESLPTMASLLRDRGYLTGAFTGVGAISAKFGFLKGFDFYSESEGDNFGSDSSAILEKARPWLRHNEDRSFLLFLHTYEAHAPYHDDYFLRKEKIPPRESPECRAALYDGDVRRADAFLGGIVEELARLDLLENTLLVVTSDHGEDLTGRYHLTHEPEHGHTLYDELLLVPLILHSPGEIPPARIDLQVRSIDILPTVFEYLGPPSSGSGPQEDPGTFQGRSLKAMIEGRDREHRPAYSEATTYGTPRESLRAGGFKYIHRLSEQIIPDPAHHDLPLTPPDELYDLGSDPRETRDLAGVEAGHLSSMRDLIRTVCPAHDPQQAVRGHATAADDIGEDKALMERLRTLGYVR